MGAILPSFSPGLASVGSGFARCFDSALAPITDSVAHPYLIFDNNAGFSPFLIKWETG